MRNRAGSRKLGVALAAVALLSAGGAFGQSRSVPFPRVNIERFSFNPAAKDSLAVDMGELLDEGGYRVGIGLQYADSPAVTRLGDEYANLRLDNRFMGHLTGAYSPNKWVQLEFQLPIIFNQSESSALSDRGFAQISSNGVISPLVGARVGLLRQHEGMPLDLALSATIGLPFGDAGALGRDPQVPFRPALSLGRDFGKVKVGGQLYAQFRSQENYGPSYRGVSPSNLDTVEHEMGLALAASGTVTDGLRAEVGLISDFALENGGNSTQTFVGARYALSEKMEVFALGGPAFGELVGTPTFRVMGGLAFGMGGVASSPKPAPAPEPIAVITPEPEPAAPPENLDTDGDGVPDSKDACPNEVGPAHRAGCPVPDKDGDGVPDDIDRCPDEKGDVDEGGCPAKDSDGDGVPDKADRCPQKAGPGTEHGCPDTDNDGLADHMDNCVTRAGPSENQGCPPKEKQLVVITQEKLQILDKVYFAPGKARIMPKSRILLNQIARVLKEHPEIEKVVIEGHTDSVGKPERNLKLSEDRANAVRTFLVKAGVAPERLDAKGFGDQNPIQPNDTADGREANRRVEFVIPQAEQSASAGSLVEPLVTQ